MTLRIGINGLGRIGRSLVRLARQRPELELVAANDLAPPEQLARLLTRESFRAAAAEPVVAGEGELRLDGVSIPLHRSATPAEIPWSEAGVEVVVEASGAFVGRSDIAGHLGGTVERVLVSANGDDLDLTVCVGVNDDRFEPRRHRIVSNASCTTN